MINWTTERIKIEHLIDYAHYRKKVGDLEAYELIGARGRGLSETVTFSDVAGPQPDQKTRAILKTAGSFILDLYRELGVRL